MLGYNFIINSECNIPRSDGSITRGKVFDFKIQRNGGLFGRDIDILVICSFTENEKDLMKYILYEEFIKHNPELDINKYNTEKNIAEIDIDKNSK